MRRFRVVALSLAVTLVVAGCGRSDDGLSAEDATLRLAVARINTGLDPASDQVASYLRSYTVGESLAKIRADGSIAPELAAAVEQTGLDQWTVTLREGLTFHSGAVVDADAVRASLERSRSLNSLASNLLTGVRITVTDPLTLVFDTDDPSPFLDFTLSHYELQIHNAAAYEAGEAGESTADLTGAFQVVEFIADQELTLERNPDWWGAAPTFERIVVQRISEEQSRAQIALAGQADIIDQLPPDSLGQVEASDLVTLAGAPAANTVAVYVNPDSPSAPALGDPRVRQALAWALDRDEVAELAGEGLTEASSSWLASNPAFPEAKEQGYTHQNLERAGQLLDDAGWLLGSDGHRAKDGERLRFRLQTWGTEGPTGEVIQSQWEALGVTVELSYVDSTLLTQARERNDWDAQTAAWTTLGDVPSLISTQFGPDGAANYGRYDVPEVPGLVQRARTAASEEERRAAILELNELMVEVLPSIPVHPRLQATGVANRVTGFVPHPLQYENLVQPGYVLGPREP